MKDILRKIERFVRSEDGPTAVEYAVMLSLIIVISLGAVRQIGNRSSSTFTAIAQQIAPPTA